MVPRNQAVWIEDGMTLAEFNRIYAKTPHVRYPVFSGTFDKVKGVLATRDVHMAMAAGELKEGDVVTGFVRPVYYVPPTKLVGELFTEMRDRGLLMAVVVSEHGGTSGIVTIRQLVEEIVGELDEELARSGSEFEAISQEAYQVSGTMRIEEANEKLGLGIPQSDYDTVGGFVLHLMGHLPAEGDQVISGNLRLVVMEVKENRIARILVSKGEPPLQRRGDADSSAGRQKG
jgi:CBS domain containing-hemolysin-like protein